MFHRDEVMGWLFDLKCLSAEQLAKLLRPGPRVVPGLGFREEGVYSRETARRALTELERNGLARRYRTIPPWRADGRGGVTHAYGLTRKGMEAGAFAAGVEGMDARKIRAMYNRGFSVGHVNHCLLRNQ